MDDKSFELWSEKLTQLRKERQALIETKVGEMATSFGPQEFSEVAVESLNAVMDAWYEFEQQSWQANTHNEPVEEIETLRTEMESILDFELESIGRDMVSVTSRISWDPSASEQANATFAATTDELRKKFQLKVKNIGGGESPVKKKTREPLPPIVKTGSFGGSSRAGNGLGLFLMFFVGLLLGGGASVYFMNAAKDVERKFQEDRSKMLSEQNALSDNIAVLHDNFEQLATGKMKNLPDLESRIHHMQESFYAEKSQLKREHDRNREKLMKKMPAGNHLDAALEDLNSDFSKKMAEITKREAAALDPMTKQRNVLKELISH